MLPFPHTGVQRTPPTCIGGKSPGLKSLERVTGRPHPIPTQCGTAYPI